MVVVVKVNVGSALGSSVVRSMEEENLKFEGWSRAALNSNDRGSGQILLTRYLFLVNRRSIMEVKRVLLVVLVTIVSP